MSDPLTAWARRYSLLILIVIVAAGAFLRLHQINSLPPGADYDAAQYGLDALRILDGARPIFLAANFGREPLFSYLVAFVYLFTGPGTLGILLSSAMIGIVTIPAVYLAARELLDEATEIVKVWTPLLAALVTAVSYWHLNYSRTGLRVIWVPLFACLLTAALWRGLHRGSRPALALAGVLLGLSQYTYQAARLLPLLVLAGFILTYLGRRSFTRHDLVDTILTFGLAFLVFTPLGLFAVDQPDVYYNRLRQTALFGQDGEVGQQIAAISDQALLALRMFFIEGDNHPLYTIPGRPSLNPFQGFAFLAGIAVALWRWKKPAMLYLLAWLLLLTAPAMIADQAATAKRALGAVPAVIILIALGLVVPYTLLYNRSRDHTRWPSALFAFCVAVGLAWTAASNFNDYFLRWGQDPALAAHYERDQTEIGLAAARIPRDESVLISPFTVTHPALQLNSNRHPDMRSYNGHLCLIIPDRQDNGVTYLIVPGEKETSLEQLSEIFPDGWIEEGPQRPDREEPYYIAYHVPPGASRELGTTKAQLLNWNDEIGLLDFTISPEQAVAGETVTITMTYKALKDLDTSYTAYIHLLGPDDGGVPLVQSDSIPCGGASLTRRWREGEIIRDRVKLHIADGIPPGTYQLTTGFYTWPELTPLPLKGQDLSLLATIDIK